MPITYCIVCNITGEKYYGSTVQSLKQRMNHHRCVLNCVSRQIILRGDYDVYPLHEYETELEARLKEGWYIDNKECINERRVCVTDEEKKEYYKVYNKKYNQENRETIQKKVKIYGVKYREKNKERIKLKKAEKVQCEFCNEYSTSSHLRRHQRSKKCLKFQ